MVIRAPGYLVPPFRCGRATPERPSRRAPETRLARPHDRLRARLDVEPVEDARDVVAHGLLRQAERGGNLRVVAAARQQFEQLALAPRERREAGGGERRIAVW